GGDEPVQAVAARGEAQGGEIEPAPIARATGGRAVLSANEAQTFTGFAVEPGWERPRSDPRGVGLGDAPDPVDHGRSNPEAGAHTARDRRARGHVGIGAVVDVEQRSLGALE